MSIQPSGLPARKILIADDDVIIVRILSFKLVSAGYQVITALAGAGVMTAARTEHPDLILMDVNFPPELGTVQWSGYLLMEWLKQQPAIQTIPVIIITGSQDPQTQKRAADAGAVACFQKPLNYELLLKAIHATLGDVPLVKNESPGAGSNPSS